MITVASYNIRKSVGTDWRRQPERILRILGDDTLVSLPWVSVAVAQSVIPISAVLIIIAQVLVFPEVLDEARRNEVTKAEELI